MYRPSLIRRPIASELLTRRVKDKGSSVRQFPVLPSTTTYFHRCRSSVDKRAGPSLFHSFILLSLVWGHVLRTPTPVPVTFQMFGRGTSPCHGEMVARGVVVGLGFVPLSGQVISYACALDGVDDSRGSTSSRGRSGPCVSTPEPRTTYVDTFSSLSQSVATRQSHCPRIRLPRIVGHTLDRREVQLAYVGRWCGRHRESVGRVSSPKR